VKLATRRSSVGISRMPVGTGMLSAATRTNAPVVVYSRTWLLRSELISKLPFVLSTIAVGPSSPA
jgi:hypothetical protein